jgi:hypothetical protein
VRGLALLAAVDPPGVVDRLGDGQAAAGLAQLGGPPPLGQVGVRIPESRARKTSARIWPMRRWSPSVLRPAAIAFTRL